MRRERTDVTRDFMNSSDESLHGMPEALRYFAQPSYARAFYQAGTTLALYAVSIYAMYQSLSIHYGLTLLLSLVATAAYLRLFMIGHDCAHRSYLPRRWQNEVLGNFIGVLTNTPLRYWGTQHMEHHRTMGNLDQRGAGDVTTMTVEEFANADLLQRTWYRIYRNPWILMLIFAPIHFVFMQRWPFEHNRVKREIWLSIMGTNVGIVVYYSLMIWLMGFEAFLLVYVPVVTLSAIGAVWLFYIQHQFEDTYWERDNEWTYKEATLNGSSFYDLPRIGHWISGNIGYHHIHHLNPRVPNYRLAACHAAIPAFSDVKHIAFLESFARAHLALWDEPGKRLISFAEFDRRNKEAAGAF